MNELSLDLSDADIAKALKDCEDGEHVEFTVGGTLKKSGTTATVDLDEVKYTGSDDESAEPADDKDGDIPEDEGDKTPSSDADATTKPSKVPPAVSAVMSKSPKGYNKQSN